VAATRASPEARDVDAAGWDARYAATDLVWSAGPNRTVVDEVSALPPGRALDLAAGEGRNAVWLAERGWRVTAIDFSAVGVDKGRQRAHAAGVEGAVTWVVADATSWDPDGAYDLVLVCFLHLPAPRRREAHHRAAAALAPGGTLLIVGHDLDNLARGHGGPQDPEVLLTVERVAADLADTGLTIAITEQIERPVEVDGAHHVALDTLVRAQRPSP
jgi:SAM-dependent methyltransferase